MTDATLRIFDPEAAGDLLFRLFEADIELGPFDELTYTFSGLSGTGAPAQFVLFGSGDVDNRDRPLPDATFDRFLLALDGATVSVIDDFTASGEEVAPLVSAFLGRDIAGRGEALFEFLETRALKVIGSPDADAFDATDNDDVLRGRGGDDSLDGAEGDDKIAGGRGRDVLEGDFGDDRMAGQAGSDFLDGGEGNDGLGGGLGSDVLLGGDGDDSMAGNGGADILDGGDGRDDLIGGAGDDVMTGGRGNDGLNGGSGDDVLVGGRGDDLLAALSGSDTLAGGDGDDTLLAGSDETLAIGGRGDDMFSFTFSAFSTGADAFDIRDFDRRGDDVILLRGGPLSFEELGIEARGNGSVVTYEPDPSVVIIVRGVAPDELTADDFIF